MPGPIHLPPRRLTTEEICRHFQAPIVSTGSVQMEITPFGRAFLGAMAAIEKARLTSLAPTGWPAREHEAGPKAPLGQPWVGKGKRRKR